MTVSLDSAYLVNSGYDCSALVTQYLPRMVILLDNSSLYRYERARTLGCEELQGVVFIGG